MDFNTLQNLQEAYQEVSQLMELTGGKGHPGYKAGSRDLGPMQDGHPADTVKRRIKGGTMSQRHGYHLGDIDDKDDDDGDEYESIVKQQSRDKRETVRKPLRDKVRAARKRMTKEDYELVMELTGGKGHPGYKAGSRDLGPMQSGHPADTFKRTMKGGTMSMRHGDHLGDLDDKDDDEGDLEAGLKDTARKKRENVRKPLRDKVRAARKRMTKEDYELDIYDIILSHLLAEGYADTNKAALVIVANMSEQWKQSILEG